MCSYLEVIILWCKLCNRETYNKTCEICGSTTEEEMPLEVYWCADCKTPIIKVINAIDRTICPICGKQTQYLCADLRPVFPEERLMLELLIAKPFEYKDKSVWASNSRYYINGKVKTVTTTAFAKANVSDILSKLELYNQQNSYEEFNNYIDIFIRANSERLVYLKDETYSFINSSAKKYSSECIVISFSGGKDSTVVADLVVRALDNPKLVHIFGDTTLELPSTIEYVKRFRKYNPKAIIKTAKNKEQNFNKVCEDIGPPARMMRWCCSMFKTGPITRILNNIYQNKDILTYYGIRKCESVSRSKYKRIEDSAESIKIQKQTVASPIFFWKNIDIWLYILSEKIDFNHAYRLGYDRVGCWCCPNNNERAQFLARIYMPEQSMKWRDLLVDFAKQIGKPDAEIYVDTGKWKARQGGNGVDSADDIKIKFTNCTAEENAKIYQLNKPINDSFYTLFAPFGKVSKELGRKLINETIVLDIKTNVPILSIQPFKQDEYTYSVKIKTLNVKSHDDLQRMVGYQIRKYNACRKCLKCESLCKYGAITIKNNEYYINDNTDKNDPKRCRRCKMCVTAKYLDGGCLMAKYLAQKNAE